MVLASIWCRCRERLGGVCLLLPLATTNTGIPSLVVVWRIGETWARKLVLALSYLCRKPCLLCRLGTLLSVNTKGTLQILMQLIV